MPPPPDLSSYRLSDADSQRIFLEEILPAEFPVSGGAPSPSTRGQPLAVLAVGQTGAGKTRLAPALLQALSAVAPAPTHLIADTYKTYHPSYARLMQTAPQHASAATGPDARRWLAQAAREATARRVDVVLESACRHPDDFAELAALFRAAGYRVEVVVMAVPAALSRLGILARFYSRAPEAHSRGLPVRLTPTKVHEDAYAGLLRAAAWLDEDGAKADQVVGKSGRVWVGARRGEASTIEAAVERERCRPLTEVERRIALEDVQKLDEHEEAREQLEEVKGLLKPLIEDGAQDGTHSPLVPLVFAQKDGDERASNVLRLGYV
ncbi:zeta toxin family [Cordyceps militaris]|uniref:Zeta toxin family n=1 Tax=Cordyceps militaris TaxID=73501 RepID=A0A2H4SG71_CORMI|nr:zeta toxin family [Cordyceps militaris]